MGYLIHALGGIALSLGTTCAGLLIQWLIRPWAMNVWIAALGGVAMAALYFWLEPLPKEYDNTTTKEQQP